MTTKNYSITDIMNLAYEAKEIATFQNSIAIDTFTSNFKEEVNIVLIGKISEIEEALKEVEFKVEIKH